MTLVPYSDDWTRCCFFDVVVDDDNNFDVINRLAEEMGVTGTVWNSWQNAWFGERQWTGTESSSSTYKDFKNGGIATIRTTTTRSSWNTRRRINSRSGIETSIQSSVDHIIWVIELLVLI